MRCRLGLTVCVLLQSYQTDWEAILSRTPQAFIASVSKWLYPPAARTPTPASGSKGGTSGTDGFTGGATSEAAAGITPPHVRALDGIPVVKEIMGTLRARLEALNGPKALKIHAL